MKKLFSIACLNLIAMLLIISCAQQKGLEQGRETVSATGTFGEVRRTPEAKVGEKSSKAGVIDSTESLQPALKDTARVKAIRRDPNYRPVKPKP